jgi:hypothetical protein
MSPKNREGKSQDFMKERQTIKDDTSPEFGGVKGSEKSEAETISVGPKRKETAAGFPELSPRNEQIKARNELILAAKKIASKVKESVMADPELAGTFVKAYVDDLQRDYPSFQRGDLMRTIIESFHREIEGDNKNLEKLDKERQNAIVGAETRVEIKKDVLSRLAKRLVDVLHGKPDVQKDSPESLMTQIEEMEQGLKQEEASLVAARQKDVESISMIENDKQNIERALKAMSPVIGIDEFKQDGTNAS